MINELLENPSDAGFFGRSESVSIEKRTNPALLVRADLGFSPPQFPIEPYLSFGISSLLNPVAFDHPALTTTDFGTALWYLSVGARWRFTTGAQFHGEE